MTKYIYILFLVSLIIWLAAIIIISTIFWSTMDRTVLAALFTTFIIFLVGTIALWINISIRNKHQLQTSNITYLKTMKDDINSLITNKLKLSDNKDEKKDHKITYLENISAEITTKMGKILSKKSKNITISDEEKYRLRTNTSKDFLFSHKYFLRKILKDKKLFNNTENSKLELGDLIILDSDKWELEFKILKTEEDIQEIVNKYERFKNKSKTIFFIKKSKLNNFLNNKALGKNYYLNYQDFSDLNLFLEDFLNAELIDSIFSNVYLSEANFKKSQLLCLKFKDSNFTGANFSESRIFGADFSGAVLTGANFSGSVILGTDFSGADLSKANFFGVDFNNIEYVSEWGSGDIYRKLSLNFSNTNLEKTKLSSFF